MIGIDSIIQHLENLKRLEERAIELYGEIGRTTDKGKFSEKALEIKNDEIKHKKLIEEALSLLR